MASDAALRRDTATCEAAYERVATTIQWTSRAGMLALVATFIPYIAGWTRVLIPTEKLPQVWALPLQSFLRQTSATSGWKWLFSLDAADSACLIGIAILCASSAIGLLGALVAFWRDRDRIPAIVCLLQVIVLAVAASGVLTHG